MTGVIQSEREKFDAIADRWWDPEGPMAPLHRLNPTRLAYVKRRCVERFGLDADAVRPLSGLRALDVGCGAGLLAEPIARMGAEVVGVDPAAEALAVGRRRAREAGLKIDYREATIDAIVESGERFDLVLGLEVIEHVDDQPGFVSALTAAARPGGLIVLSTLNRTRRAFLEAIVGAEWLLRWLPIGTHDHSRFCKPSEVARWFRDAGAEPIDASGLRWRPAEGGFALSRDLSTNYLLSARR